MEAEAKRPKQQSERDLIIAGYKQREGDYRIKVRIYEANDLLPKTGGLAALNPFNKKAGTADPIVIAEVMGKKKFTKPKLRTLSPIWNQTFYFNFTNLKKQELEAATIKFTVIDKNSFLIKDAILGSYEIDLTSVYFAYNHELYQIWLTLTDPTDEREGIMGYLKVSLECLGPNDEPVIHDVQTDKDPNTAAEKTFFSEKVKQEGHCIAVDVYRGENLAPMDFLSTETDGFVSVKYSGISKGTKVVSSRNPEWYQQVKIGCMLPNQSKYIKIETWEYDLLGRNDMIGSLTVKFKDIKEKKLNPCWANLYGPPLSGKGRYADLMSLYGEDLGSHYRGRILYNATSYYTNDPKTETVDLVYKFPEMPIPSSPQKSYILRIDILEAHELPQRKQGIFHICIGPYFLKTDEFTIENSRSIIYVSLPDKKMVLPCNVSEIPDLIIYFTDENEEFRRHCYSRLKASEILIDQLDYDQIKVNKPRVVKLKEDKSLALVKDDEFPGFLYARVQLWGIAPPPKVLVDKSKIEFTDFQLRVHLYVGRGLPPADEGGQCDPMVRIRCAGQTVDSNIKQNTLNPGWYQTITMDVSLPSFTPDGCPSGMSMILYDTEDGKTSELLGRCWITFQPTELYYKVTEGLYDGELVPIYYRKPKWWNVFFDAKDEVMGRILMGYTLIKSDVAEKVPVESIYPDMKAEKIDVFLIGVRDIEEDVGFKPSRISLTFDISGDQYEPFQIMSQKIENGGININDHLEIELEIPRNKNLCSVMELLGLGTIDLSQFISFFYLTKQQQIEFIEEQKEDDQFSKALYGKLIEAFELEENPMDPFVPWELPQRRLVVADDKYEEVKREQELKARGYLEEIAEEDGSENENEEEGKDGENEGVPINENVRLAHTIEMPMPKKLDNEEGENTLENPYNDSERRNLTISSRKPVKRPTAEVKRALFKDEEAENFVDGPNLQGARTPPYLGLTNQRDSSNLDIREEGKVVSRRNSSHKEIKVMMPPPLDEEKKNLLQESQKKEAGVNNNVASEARIKDSSIRESKDVKIDLSRRGSIQSQKEINGADLREGQGPSQDNGRNSAMLKPKPSQDLQISMEKNNDFKVLPPENKQDNIFSRKGAGKSSTDQLAQSSNQPKDGQENDSGLKSLKKRLISQSNILEPIDEELEKKKNKNKLDTEEEQRIKEEKEKEICKQLDELSRSSYAPDHKKKLKTLRITRRMDFSEPTHVSSHALSIGGLPQDNLEVRPLDKRQKKKKDDGLRGRFRSLFGGAKSLSSRLLNKMKKSIEHYEEYDTDPEEDLDITPPWLRGRERFTDDLEDKVELNKDIRKFAINRGQVRGKGVAFLTDKTNEIKEVAYLKGIFFTGLPEDKLKEKIETLQKMMRPKQFVARVYILTGKDIQPATKDGLPDCYLKVKLGKTEICEKEKTLKKANNNPYFYQCYELPCSLPGNAYLRVEVWDDDGFGEDEMIGYTEADLEDRFLSQKWHAFNKKPIEMRNLKPEFGKGSQGRIEMWIDLIEKKDVRKILKEKIGPPQQFEFELRVIVWETVDVVFKDELEKCNDLYCTGAPATADEMLETDVHWRCRNKGSFNYRWKFKCKFPLTDLEYGADRFKIQLWDKDIVAANDMIGEATINLNDHHMIEKAVKRQKPVKMKKRVIERGGEVAEKIWFDVYHPEEKDEADKPISQGKVLLSFELIPIEEAKKKENGMGRETPNNYPILPEPEGRFKFDFLNPLGMLKELLGPSLYRKCCMTICCVIMTALLIYFGWMFIVNGITLGIMA